MFQNELVKTENQTLIRGGCFEISILNGTGDVRISQSKDDKISISARERVKAKGKELKTRILDNINILAEKKDKSIVIGAVTKDHGDLWEWKQTSFPAAQISIDYQVKIPKGMGSFTVNTRMGKIEVDDLQGALKTHTGMGDIHLSKVVLEGENNISTDSGYINAEISQMEEAGLVNISSDLGNIKLNVPHSAKYSLETKVSNRDSQKQVVHGGGSTLVQITADLGTISVNGKRQ